MGAEVPGGNSVLWAGLGPGLGGPFPFRAGEAVPSASARVAIRPLPDPVPR